MSLKKGASSEKEKAKANSFFNNTGKFNGSMKTEKVNRTNIQDSSQISNREDSMVRTVDNGKKLLSRTQMDLKPTLREISSNKSGSQQPQKNAPTTQKVSLQDFVTKVNKGK